MAMQSGGLDMSKVDLIFDKVLSRLLNIISDLEKQGKKQAEIGKALGVKQSTVSLLKSGKRGEGIRLKTAIAAFRHSGGSMAQLLEDVLDNKKASVLIALAEEDEEFFDSLLEILEEPSKDRDKLRSDVLYMKSKISK